MKKSAPQQVDPPAIPQIVYLDVTVAAPSGQDLAQTQGFLRMLVQAPAILVVPRAPRIVRPLGFFAPERRSLAKEPDDRHGQNIVSGKWPPHQKIVAMALNKSGIRRRRFESLMGSNGA